MIRTISATVAILCVGAAASRPCWAQGEGASPRGAEAEALERLRAIRSAYQEGRDADVLLAADRALLEMARAGGSSVRTGEIHFWRGAALRRLGRTEEALVAFDQAKAAGFQEPELYLERSLAQQSLGQVEEAEREWQEGERFRPEDLERWERLSLRRQREERERRRLQLWVTPQLGYDSNVLGLEEDTPLQQGDVDFASPFLGAYVDARYFLVRNGNQVLWLNYQGMAREYPEEPDVSYVDNVLAVVGRQPLLGALDVEVRSAVGEAFLREDGHFRTQRALGPAILARPFEAVQARLWGDWTRADYYASVPNEQDRDGTMGRVGIGLGFDVGGNWSVSPSLAYVKYNAEGSDYDFRGWDVGLTVTPPEAMGLLLVPSLGYGDYDYGNPNSLTNFEERRKDRTLRATLSVTLRALERAFGYTPTLSISYLRQKSNVEAFDYSRWAPHIELGINVLSF
jgi:tetratricopeptide (TPR) repeat protein